jgi:hypothetical protein
MQLNALKRLESPFLATQSRSWNDGTVTEEAKAPASCFGHWTGFSILRNIGTMLGKDGVSPHWDFFAPDIILELMIVIAVLFFLKSVFSHFCQAVSTSEIN